ncbi:uncharacterized protein C3orf86 homolog [Ochotona curzoniae]|uniref:uncharacterized protein C3orf86 homolog n=1 Tax=Ochotona curzoniae TaxID=130825 RepID=UPI001B346C38|nr:uncharacterized protein C3orf86 homolog [Ochotona curzoniae]
MGGSLQDRPVDLLFSFSEMSGSQLAPGKKPLDTIFWENEITGEITYCPWEAPMEGVPEESRPQHEDMQGTPPLPQRPPATPAQRPTPVPSPKASLKDKSSRYPSPWAPTQGQATPGARSTSRYPEFAITMPPPEGAPPTLSPLCLGHQATSSPHPSAPWAFTCEVKNANRNDPFSF